MFSLTRMEKNFIRTKYGFQPAIAFNKGLRARELTKHVEELLQHNSELTTWIVEKNKTIDDLREQLRFSEAARGQQDKEKGIFQNKFLKLKQAIESNLPKRTIERIYKVSGLNKN